MPVLIDFEEKFTQYLHEYTHKKAVNDEELDELVPGLYLSWLDAPADWLAGQTPNAYFSSMSEERLVEMLGRYVLKDMALPTPLLYAIVDKSEKAHPLLVALMKNYEGEKSDALKTAIVRLIEEMDLPRPYDYYIEVIAASAKEGDLTEACVDELKGAGAHYTDSVLAAYEEAGSRYAADCFLDILSDMPFDQRAFEHVLERFLYSESKKAFYASLLGKLGSENALPYLEEILRQPGIRYYDYVAIKNAYEALGGEIDIEWDFSGDEDYELLIKNGGTNDGNF